MRNDFNERENHVNREADLRCRKLLGRADSQNAIHCYTFMIYAPGGCNHLDKSEN